jgi:hypothetical protein
MTYADDIAEEAAGQMLAAHQDGACPRTVESVLERVILEHARTIGEAHLIRDRGWSAFNRLRRATVD